MIPLKVGGQCSSDHVVGSSLLMPVLSDSNHCQTLSTYCLHSSADTTPSIDVQPRCCKSKAARAAALRASTATEGAVSLATSAIELEWSTEWTALIMNLDGALKRNSGCRELRITLGASSAVYRRTGCGRAQESVREQSILTQAGVY